MKIVLSRTDRVGDLILSTPAIASIRASFPEAHVTAICSRHNRVVVERNPDIDALVVLEDGERPSAAGRRLRGADLAIALAPRTADFAIVAATRARRRIGYTYVRRYLVRAAARLRLTDVLISEADPMLCERDPSRVVPHEVDQVLALVERAGGTRIVRDLVVPIGEDERGAVAGLPSGAITVQLSQRWLAVGSTQENVFQLLRDLRVFGRPIVATYGEESNVLGEAVRSSGLADRVAGALPFLVWAAAIERAGCVVTVDTGATHVASAMRRPTVVLFEHRFFRLSSQEWSPYRVPGRSLRKPPDERPESLQRSRAEIVAAVRSLLDA